LVGCEDSRNSELGHKEQVNLLIDITQAQVYNTQRNQTQSFIYGLIGKEKCSGHTVAGAYLPPRQGTLSGG
jgi:hypothetical protein